MPVTERIITVSSIPYWTQHTTPPASIPSKGTVLLIHALMSNSNMYSSTITALVSAGYSTITFDHIGHAKTSLPPRDPSASSAVPPITMDELASHIVHLTTSILPPHESLLCAIGCSIGGVLTLRIPVLFPHITRSVISICAPGLTPPPTAHQAWAERIKLFEADPEALCRQTVERWFPGDVETQGRALAHVRECSVGGYKVLADTIRGYDYAGTEGEIGRGCARVLVVAGEVDGASRVETLRGIAGRIEGGEVVVIEGAGHLPPMQKEGEFERIVLEFLPRVQDHQS